MHRKLSSKFRCTRLQSQGRNKCACSFTDPKKEGDHGCGASIAVPRVSELLDLDTWQKQEDCKQDICESREKGGAILALGAGISIPAKMPGWTGLLSRMSGYAFQYRDYISGSKLKLDDQARLCLLEDELISGQIEILNGINALEAGQYINLVLSSSRILKGDGEGLIKDLIAEIIAKNTPPEGFLKQWQARNPKMDPKHKNVTAREKAFRNMAKDNTLCAVAYMLQNKNGFRRALTYNYDTLVQEYLISVFNVDEKRIITHADRWTTVPSSVTDPIEILHVHGCLPRPGQQGEGTAFPKESRRLILSEDSYYNMERDEAYDWRSSVQSYYFNRNSCIFVGFSAEDYNFRRILRQMGNKERDSYGHRPNHYLILTIDQLAKDIYASICRNRLKGKMNIAEIATDAKLLLGQELSMKAAYWERYGFYPIWATVNEIPDILLSLLN